MRKQTRASKAKKKADSNCYGTGKVTPGQIAFLVHRYLSDNGCPQARDAFRFEAPHLFPKSPPQEAPKDVMTLAAIMEDYISLKEQRLILDQERFHLERERCRVQTLLQGMQDAMNAYNVGNNGQNMLHQNLPPSLVSSVTAKSTPQSLLSAVTTTSTAMPPQMDLMMGSPAGYPMYSTPVMMPSLRPSTSNLDKSSLSTPVANKPASKRRKSSRDVSDVPVNAKRSCNSSNQLSIKGTNPLSFSASAVNDLSRTNDNASKSTAPIQGSSIAKCLFNKATPSPPTNTSVPKTPNQSTSSQTDKSASPLQTSSSANSGDNVTPHQSRSTNRILISSETIRVSPSKQLTYYSVERNHCISSSPMKTNLMRLNTREHVKGRLNFDAVQNQENGVSNVAYVPKSDNEGDIFDLDLPNLDLLGGDYSLSELLSDFNPDATYSGQPTFDSSPSSHSGSPGDTWETETGAHQVFTKLSTVTEIFSEKDMNAEGQEAVTSVQSRTKSIKIISPVKNNSNSCLDQENKGVMN